MLSTRLGVEILSKKALILAVLIAISSFVSLLSPVATVYASKYTDMSQTDKLKAWSYARYVLACYEKDAPVEGNKDKVASGQLFYDKPWYLGGGTVDTLIDIGPIKEQLIPNEKYGGSITCGYKDSELTKKAFSAWGISPTDFVCAMNYKRNSDNIGCKNGTSSDFKSGGGLSKDERVANFKKTIKSLVGINLDSIGNDIKYLRGIERLKTLCGVNFSSEGSGGASGDYAYSIKYIDQNGKKYEPGALGGQRSKSSILFGGDDLRTCADAEKYANDNYNAYKDELVRQNSAARCDQKRYEGQLQTICIDGATHKDSGESYCGKYTAVDQKEACQWGQGIENPTKPPEATDNNEDTTSCAIDGIGWMICPVIQFMADVADKSYGFIGDNFLAIDAELFDGSNGGQTRASWQAVQGIANIAFVVAFIVIIYSQLTGTGISNYGVKKMLPRIIIAAILVNISYVICQLAVDISNVLGYGLRNTLPSIVTQGNDGIYTSSFDFGKSAATILAAGIGVGLALPLLGTGVVAAVVALVFVGILLIARKALIVLLVVISPLAFVAYLLPNTEQFFTKWRKMFIGLLAVFPVVGLLFGAGSLASAILRTSANDTVSQLIAAIVGILPLFAVWPVLKGSLDAAGSIGAKINGMSKSAQSSADNARRNVQSRIKNSELAQYRNGLKAQRAAEIKAGAYKGRLGIANPRNWASSFNRGFNNSGLSGGFGDQRAAEAVGIANSMDETAMKSATALLQSKNLTAEQMNQLAMSDGNNKEYNELMKNQGINAGDARIRQAAVGIAMGQNGLAANLTLIGHTKESGDEGYRKAVAKGMMENKLADNAAFLGGDMVDTVARTGVDTNDVKAAAASTIERQKYSTNSVAKQDPEALKIISDVAKNGYTVVKDGQEQTVQVDAQRLQALRAQAQEVQSTEEIAHGVTGAQAEHINDIANGGGAKEGQDFNTR